MVDERASRVAMLLLLITIGGAVVFTALTWAGKL